ncbi:MAG TPA: DUF6285 domain-containing protein [Mycobacteriales bacterium]|nr:DUF6285 domain-containing protein [Mycobacteriales bacterium]
MTALNARPTAAELVEAVREFLDGSVLPDGAPPGAFHVRVAVGALRIVERDLACAEDHRRRHDERLAALGFADDAALAGALRRREVPAAQLPAVRAAVLAGVEDALRIANPRHLTGDDS